MGGRIAMLLAVAGCGRFGFGEPAPGSTLDGSSAGDDSGSSGDAAPRTFLFEDGFEGTLAPWNALNNVIVDSGPPAPIEGAGALRAQANTATSSRAEVALPRMVGAGASFFVRGYFYLPSGYPIADLSLLEIVQPGIENLVVMGAPELGLYSSIGPGGQASTFPLPRDVWLCIEARIEIADAPLGTVELWADDVLRLRLTDLDTFAGGIEQLTTGVTWAGTTQAPSLVYVDDIIADDAGPIGCR